MRVRKNCSLKCLQTSCTKIEVIHVSKPLLTQRFGEAQCVLHVNTGLLPIAATAVQDIALQSVYTRAPSDEWPETDITWLMKVNKTLLFQGCHGWNVWNVVSLVWCFCILGHISAPCFVKKMNCLPYINYFNYLPCMLEPPHVLQTYLLHWAQRCSCKCLFCINHDMKLHNTGSLQVIPFPINGLLHCLITLLGDFWADHLIMCHLRCVFPWKRYELRILFCCVTLKDKVLFLLLFDIKFHTIHQTTWTFNSMTSVNILKRNMYRKIFFK